MLRRWMRHDDTAAVEPGEPDSTAPDREDVPVGFNPARDGYLYWRTEEGYIIAEDTACQYDYVSQAGCRNCGGKLVTLAQLNRGGQGLVELVAICPSCRERHNFIFDISNQAYQQWWADQLGENYVCQFEGAPRAPFSPPNADE